MAKSSTNRGFPPDFIERVIDSTDYLGIIGRYTTLKKAGKNYLGLCPFHQEKTPSFSVDPDKGLFYCFGCGKGGNIVSFVMEKEGLSFPESIEFLAKEAGIPVPSRRRVSSATEAMQQAVEETFAFYQKLLLSSQDTEGLKYLQSRGIDKKLARDFGFGWAIQDWDTLLTHIKKKGLDTEPFLQTGLLIKHEEKNSLYDRFRGGLIIPIRNSAGRLVGFAMRSLDKDDRPKYINSPESQLYHKSELLFGLHVARKAIRQKGFAILVEGYFDVLSLWQAGFQNTVASCGTSFTRTHANLLARFTDAVVVFYDGDDAGLNATYRAIEPLLRYELMIKIARPPDENDPDDVARQWDSNKIEEFLGNAPDWFDFSIEVAKQSGLWDSVEGKLRFADKIAPYISILGDSLTGALYRGKLADILGVGETQIAKRIAKVSKKRGQTNVEVPIHKTDDLPPEAYTELDLIAMTLSNPMLGEIVLKSNSLVLYKGVVESIVANIEMNGECSIELLSEFLDPRALSYLTKTIIGRKKIPTNADAEDLFRDLDKRRIERQLDDLRRELKKAEIDGNQSKRSSLLVQISELKKEKVELSSQIIGGHQ